MTAPATPYTIEMVTWVNQSDTLSAIRREVFIDEQKVPEALEWDGLDPASHHVLARNSKGVPVGCGRMLMDGHIGRMAVRAPFRQRGIGTALLSALIEQAVRDGHSQVFLDAQVSAIGFYQRLGFRAHGTVFMDAGIPHRHMERQISPTP